MDHCTTLVFHIFIVSVFQAPNTPTDIIIETDEIDPKAVKMEKLRHSIDKQEQYLNIIAANFLKHLNTSIEGFKSSSKAIPLAQHTRHFRLGRILQVRMHSGYSGCILYYCQVAQPMLFKWAGQLG